MPRITVVIPVFNRVETIGRAVASVLAQSIQDLKVIVVDYGSTDGSAEAVQHLDDGRLRIIRLGHNRGIPEARNVGLAAVDSEFVAWLDSDDLARPTRLERQLKHLAANPGVAFVGACAGKICWNGQRRLGARAPPLQHEDIAAWLLFRSAFQNSAVTGRTEIFQRYPYRSQYPVCEDIDQFQRIAAEHRTANLPSVLIDRRLHNGQIIRERSSDMHRLKLDLFAQQLGRLGVHAAPDDIARHVQLGNPKLPIVDADRDFLCWAEEWLASLARANRMSRLVDEQAMSLAGSFFWARACAEAVPQIGWIEAGQRLVTAEPGRHLGAARARHWLGRMLQVQVTSSLRNPLAP